MEVIQKYKNESGEEYARFEISATSKQGKRIVEFMCGEPEDAKFYRDLNDVFRIKDLIELAYNAGMNGEEFIFVKQEFEEGEE